MPTNYCEPFGPQPLHNLLTALATLWEVAKDSCHGTGQLLTSHNLIVAAVNGVKHLLVRAFPNRLD